MATLVYTSTLTYANIVDMKVCAIGQRLAEELKQHTHAVRCKIEGVIMPLVRLARAGPTDIIQLQRSQCLGRTLQQVKYAKPNKLSQEHYHVG